uniref:Uncharacterized protein n=1 Tax=Rhipicephalus microplus TaxID=6941 RepID=A0A6G5AH27_RHIMP
MVDETTVKKSLYKIAQHFNNYFHSILFHSDVGNLFYSSALEAHGVDYFIQWYSVNAFEFKNSEITWPRLYPKYVSEAEVIALFLNTVSSFLVILLSAQTLEDRSSSACFKKRNHSSVENYQPISLTSFCCKLIEHITEFYPNHRVLSKSQSFNQITEFLERNSI